MGRGEKKNTFPFSLFSPRPLPARSLWLAPFSPLFGVSTWRFRAPMKTPGGGGGNACTSGYEKVKLQGRNMVYPTPIDPYFLAVILIPEPHFPQNFDP